MAPRTGIADSDRFYWKAFQEGLVAAEDRCLPGLDAAALEQCAQLSG